jgi:hypothetical protein
VVWGVFLFGCFILDKQNKVSRLKAKKDGSNFHHFTLSLTLSLQGREDKNWIAALGSQ